jgi:hypothetical protein
MKDRQIKNTLNYVDLCFVVDTTGSMSGFIQAAQRQLIETIKLLSGDRNINLQIGLVEYRDHPPQDKTFVTRLYPLTANLQRMQKVINHLKAEGGGDAPEAVYRGIHDACTKIKWRSHSCRFILLVGDAPPHGFYKWLQEMLLTANNRDRMGDTWADGCPSGLNVQAVTAAAEKHRAIVHALCMRGDTMTVQAFSALSQATGGQCVQAGNADDVISKIRAMLQNEFQNLEFDRQVLETVQNLGYLDLSETAEVLSSPRLPVAAAVARLGKRGFL